MQTTGLGKVLDHLRRAAAPADAGGLTDGELLARFGATGDEASFAAVVGRHGPMVLGVCRRLLRHEQDAEDAFQAVFFVLARKAGSLRWGDTVGPWLYEVATRTALDCRAWTARRRAREGPLDAASHPAVEPLEPEDWRPVLDRELTRLPSRYRAAIVLCELEGRTRAEAAGLLGVPEGTLSSRLARGKEILARRLARLAPAGGLAALVAEGGARAAVPAALAGATARTSLLVAAGLEVATSAAPAAAIMKGVLKAMFLMKLKVASAVMVFAALGAGGFAYQAGRPSKAQAEAPADKAPLDAEALRRENELLKLNLEVVLKEVRSLKAEVVALNGRAAKVGAGPANAAGLHYRLRTAAGTAWLERDGRLELLSFPSDHRPLLFSLYRGQAAKVPAADPVAEMEAALEALREAGENKELKKRAADSLDRATRVLQEWLKKRGEQPAPGAGYGKQ